MRRLSCCAGLLLLNTCVPAHTAAVGPSPTRLSSRTALRSRAVRMDGTTEIPAKFVRTQWGPAVSVTLPKPLGLSLAERSGAIMIDDIVPDGSASRCPQIKMGMSLVSIGGQDCSTAGLDSAMELLSATDSTVDVVFTADRKSVV